MLIDARQHAWSALGFPSGHFVDVGYPVNYFLFCFVCLKGSTRPSEHTSIDRDRCAGAV